ncbi:MAG TPA: hypothetical protein VNM90_19030 [Haliangium sp.]|nr:hypothetical protein [Haliangium sp.]
MQHALLTFPVVARLALSLALAAGCRPGNEDAREHSAARAGSSDTAGTASAVAPPETATPATVPIDAAPRIDAAPLRGDFSCDSARLVGGDGKATRSDQVPPDRVRLPEHPQHPVFAWSGMASHDGVLYVASGDEVRRVVRRGTRYTLERVAGQSQAATDTSHFRGGVSCSEARFRSLGELVAMADGSLVVMDHKSNAVLRIVQPDQPAKCSVHYVSGTSDQMDRRPGEGTGPRTVPADGPLIGEAYPNPGNDDGDFRTARHYQPLLPAVIHGHVYVLETSARAPRTRVVRKIALDPASSRARAVTTLASFDQVYSAFGFTALNDTLYLLAVEGANGAEGVIYEIDPDTGSTREVTRAGREAWKTPGSQALRLSGLTDCDGFLCTAAAYHLWRIHPRTGAIEVFAGAGNVDPRGMELGELGASYDHLAERPARKAVLPMATSRGASRGYLFALEYDRAGDALWVSAETRQSAYLVRLAGCATSR